MAIIPPISGQDMNSTYSDYEGRVPGNGKFFDHQPSRGFSPPENRRRKDKGEKKANATDSIAQIPKVMPLMSVRLTSFWVKAMSHILYPMSTLS